MKTQNNTPEQELRHERPNIESRREGAKPQADVEGELTREELRALVVEMIG